jgi:hypothetical protein
VKVSVREALSSYSIGQDAQDKKPGMFAGLPLSTSAAPAFQKMLGQKKVWPLHPWRSVAIFITVSMFNRPRQIVAGL